MQRNVNKPATTTTKADAKRAPKRAPKPAQAKAAEKPATDKAAAREALAARIASERKSGNETFAKLSSAISVPIKPLSAFAKSYKRTVTAHAIGRKPSPRQAAALYVALVASGGKLADGTKFPRKFTLRGAQYAIENGALSSAISAGLCTYHAESETVTVANAAEIAGQIKTTGFKL